MRHEIAVNKALEIGMGNIQDFEIKKLFPNGI